MCMANVPEYIEYLTDCSFESVFMWHKRFFQMLEVNGRPKRWLLKDPSHIGHIPEILSTYPNAKFINIHRNPLESVGSFCSLTKNIRSAFTKNVDPKEVGNMVLDFWQHNLNRGIIEKQKLLSDQIADLQWDQIQESIVNTHNHFISCLKKKRTHDTSGTDNIQSLSLVFASYQSNKKRREIKLK